jgi:hypothetical protein
MVDQLEIHGLSNLLDRSHGHHTTIDLDLDFLCGHTGFSKGHSIQRAAQHLLVEGAVLASMSNNLNSTPPLLHPQPFVVGT